MIRHYCTRHYCTALRSVSGREVGWVDWPRDGCRCASSVSESPTVRVDTPAPIGDVEGVNERKEAMNSTTTQAPTIDRIDVSFGRALDEGESDLLYEYIVDFLGVEDSFDSKWTCLYGTKTEPWGISGIRILEAESAPKVMDAINEWRGLFEVS